jgi:hypothetical protein
VRILTRTRTHEEALRLEPPAPDPTWRGATPQAAYGAGGHAGPAQPQAFVPGQADPQAAYGAGGFGGAGPPRPYVPGQDPVMPPDPNYSRSGFITHGHPAYGAHGLPPYGQPDPRPRSGTQPPLAMHPYVPPSVVHRVVGVEAMEALTRVIRLTRTVVVDNTQDVEVMAVDADTAMVVAIGATSQVMVMGITAFSKRRRHLAFRSWFRSLDHCDTHWAAYE